MALTKLTVILNKISTLANIITGQATTVKTAFDHDSNVLKDYINDTLIPELDTALTQKTTDLNTHKTSTDHDGRYYTEAEINALLLAKTNLNGNHLGTWQGYSPVQSDPGIQAIVNEANGEVYEGKNYKLNNPYRHGGALPLKGQLHCHTTNSDGSDSPTVLGTAYANAEFDFYTITDHNYLTPDPTVSGITWLGVGVEESHARHLNAFDVSAMSSDIENTQDILNFHRANTKLTSLGHINWDYTSSTMTKAMEYEELMALHDYNFIEVYNGTTDSYAEKQWDWALSSGKKIFGIAVDDCHNVATAIFNSGWVVVNSNMDDKANILDNLRKGNFYASNGNDLTVSLNDNIVTTSSTSQSNIYFIGRNGRILQSNLGVTTANYSILGDEMYVRVKSVRVSDSKCAWGQPIFIDCVGDDGRQFSDLPAPLTGMARQALINSNFDIWQRGTSITNPVNGTYLADRWKIAIGNTGTLPNIVHSKQLIYNQEIYGSTNCYRVAVDGSGSGIGLTDSYSISQYIENFTSKICGWGKKVTVTFFAKSDVTGKRIGLNLEQYYGSAGSPSPIEVIKGTTFALTSTWTKYAFTFETNSLRDKSLGIGGDDYGRLKIYYLWGATSGVNWLSTDTEETFGDEGIIEITQIQLSATDKPIQYLPKTYSEELRDCQRYYEKSYNNNVYPSTITDVGSENYDVAVANSTLPKHIRFMVEKRTNPTITVYSTATGTAGNFRNVTESVDFTAAAISNSIGTHGFNVSNSFNVIGANSDVKFQWEAVSEL